MRGPFARQGIVGACDVPMHRHVCSLPAFRTIRFGICCDRPSQSFSAAFLESRLRHHFALFLLQTAQCLAKLVVQQGFIVPRLVAATIVSVRRYISIMNKAVREPVMHNARNNISSRNVLTPEQMIRSSNVGSLTSWDLPRCQMKGMESSYRILPACNRMGVHH